MIRVMSKAIRGVSKRVVTRGPVHALKWIGHHFYERYRERRLGVDTARFDEWEGSITHPSCHAYQPLCYRCIEQALKQLSIQPNQDVFLDYGCGKGRAVIAAAQYPFRRVIGVDIVGELCDIARENVRRARRKLTCTNVEIVTADATQYQVPDDVSVIYLYNPFWDEVLAEVQERIRESLQRTPRHLRVLYLLNAGQDDAFARCTWLKQTGDEPEMWENIRCTYYESSPA